jgi:hypothetical protein
MLLNKLNKLEEGEYLDVYCMELLLVKGIGFHYLH